jgi:hypothetical protein
MFVGDLVSEQDLNDPLMFLGFTLMVPYLSQIAPTDITALLLFSGD